MTPVTVQRGQSFRRNVGNTGIVFRRCRVGRVGNVYRRIVCGSTFILSQIGKFRSAVATLDYRLVSLD